MYDKQPWKKNFLVYMSVDLICSEKQTVFQEQSSRETDSLENQKSSKRRSKLFLIPLIPHCY